MFIFAHRSCNAYTSVELRGTLFGFQLLLIFQGTIVKKRTTLRERLITDKTDGVKQSEAHN